MPYVYTDKFGVIRHYTKKGGKVSRPSLEGPAIIYPNPSDYHMAEEYYLEGQLHRPSKEGPAVIYKDGSHEYWSDGSLHRPRSEGPAVMRLAEDGEYYSKYWEFGTLLSVDEVSSFLDAVISSRFEREIL